MSFSPPIPREIPAMAPELLIVIVALVSCVAFCLVILTLVVVLYRKDPLCCRFRPYRTEHYTDDPPHYHSRQALMVAGHDECSAAMDQAPIGPQLPGRLFIIGKPNDYHMEGPLPRLPSYESVRRKDRQRQIHGMIAQRFGLMGCRGELKFLTSGKRRLSSSAFVFDGRQTSLPRRSLFCRVDGCEQSSRWLTVRV
ncbi:uncharacterized protein LOC118287995 isoform X2 [Scophthalmus maximus]|uniref:uncharacterized protein LOC118287995 isoform X2 n=1 Tax=Scophthalmus maximus TaxID=52904 RepID=UPI001FA89C14|nr:uncharacterized protein LOC118287995 isoform X2 [Scophthalmus maximus]